MATRKVDSAAGTDTVPIRASRHLRTQLKVLAASQGRPLYDLTNEALTRYIEDASRKTTDTRGKS